MVLRPPASSWDSTSCCTWVVPSQCAADGGIGVPLVVDTLVFGLYGATSGPMMARSPNRPDRQSPMMIFGDRGIRILRALLPRTGVPAVTGGVSAAPTPMPIAMAQASCRVRGSRNA